MAGRTIKVNDIMDSLPDLSDVMTQWEVPVTGDYITQEVATDGSGTIIDVPHKLNIMAAAPQPLKPEEIALKDEGQRSWSWMKIFVREGVYGELFTTQIIIIKGIKYKIKAKGDWAENGYREYQIILDFEDSAS